MLPVGLSPEERRVQADPEQRQGVGTEEGRGRGGMPASPPLPPACLPFPGLFFQFPVSPGAHGGYVQRLQLERIIIFHAVLQWCLHIFSDEFYFQNRSLATPCISLTCFPELSHSTAVPCLPAAVSLFQSTIPVKVKKKKIENCPGK
ncbi:unnamed protein product [Eretmochelys imbricata]